MLVHLTLGSPASVFDLTRSEEGALFMWLVEGHYPHVDGVKRFPALFTKLQAQAEKKKLATDVKSTLYRGKVMDWTPEKFLAVIKKGPAFKFKAKSSILSFTEEATRAVGYATHDFSER